MTVSIERATPMHAAVLTAIHRAAFPPGESWGEDAISQDPDFEAMRLARKSKDYVEMLMRAKTLVDRHPEAARAHVFLGEAYSGLGLSRNDAIDVW